MPSMHRNLSPILSATEERKEDENKKKITGKLRKEDFKFKDNLGHIAILSLSSPPPSPTLCFSHYFQTLVASRCASDKIHPSPLISSTSDILAFFHFSKTLSTSPQGLGTLHSLCWFLLMPSSQLEKPSPSTHPYWFLTVIQGHDPLLVFTRLSQGSPAHKVILLCYFAHLVHLSAIPLGPQCPHGCPMIASMQSTD